MHISLLTFRGLSTPAHYVWRLDLVWWCKLHTINGLVITLKPDLDGLWSQLGRIQLGHWKLLDNNIRSTLMECVGSKRTYDTTLRFNFSNREKKFLGWIILYQIIKKFMVTALLRLQLIGRWRWNAIFCHASRNSFFFHEAPCFHFEHCFFSLSCLKKKNFFRIQTTSISYKFVYKSSSMVNLWTRYCKQRTKICYIISHRSKQFKSALIQN